MTETPSIYRDLESKSTEWLLREYNDAVRVANRELSRPVKFRSGFVLSNAQSNASLLAMELVKRGEDVDPARDIG